jgi:nucleoside 2-deoxyribosyltransferase
LIGDNVKKIFLAVPYTYNFDENFIRRIEKYLSGLGYTVMIPHDFINEDARKANDVEKVKSNVQLDFDLLDNSDILLADVSIPSHGVGIEILHAHRTSKKVILVVKSGTRVSNMARAHAHEMLEYADLNDLEKKLKTVLTNRL